MVTARHIADPIWAGCSPRVGTLTAVFNKKNYDPAVDPTGIVEVALVTRPGESTWTYPTDDSVDIAVTVLDGSQFDNLGVENQGIGISDLPSKEEIKSINTGAQVTSAGLFLGASGVKRNYPIFKFGYVSSIPDEKIAVSCCPGCVAKLETEWMIAASLVSGNSGSPIFFVPVGFPGFGIAKQRPFLLGVQSSSFEGYDVAGMAPVQYLMEAVRKLNLADANLPNMEGTLPAHQATPSSAQPPHPAKPAPISVPEEGPHF